MNLSPYLIKKISVCFIAFFILISSCKKEQLAESPVPPDTPPTDTTTDLEPIRVMQSIYTYDDNGTLVNDTTNFTYDAEGRVISKTYSTGLLEIYNYKGDSLISILQGTQQILRVPINVNQDNFVVDLIQYGGALDTIQLTYIFNNNLQTEFWTYLHYLENPCGCMPQQHLQKERKYYNSDGNIIKTTLETPPDFIEGDQYTVTAWDDKINPKRTAAKFNALALSLPVPLESYSLHNPTVYHTSSATYEVEMTYNEEGYPLTYKFKDKNYITAKLIYNR